MERPCTLPTTLARARAMAGVDEIKGKARVRAMAGS